MTSISKNLYIEKLDDIVNKCNKMQSVNVKSSIIKKDPKFKVCDHIRISKYKNVFAKVYVSNWSEEVFWHKRSQEYLSMDICYE